jgi:hypothetical protein
MKLTRPQYTAELNKLADNISTAEKQVNYLRAQRDVSNLFLKMNDSNCNEMMVFCFQNNHYEVISSPGFFNCTDGGEMKMTFTCKDGHYSCQTGENQVCYYSQSEMEHLTKDASWENGSCEVSVKCMKISPAWSFVPEESSQTVSVANINPQMQSQGNPQMQSQGNPQMQSEDSPQMQSESTPEPSVANQ